MQEAVSIIDKLEDAVRNSSSARRVDTLRQVTDLFLHDANRLSDDQVKVFPQVWRHVTQAPIHITILISQCFCPKIVPIAWARGRDQHLYDEDGELRSMRIAFLAGASLRDRRHS
jgi:hypothetical protein